MAKVEIDGMLCEPIESKDSNQEDEKEEDDNHKRQCPNDPRFQQDNIGQMTEVDIDGVLCEPKIQEHREAVEQDGICPPDSRFIHQNKAKWCYTMFEDYERCLKLNSDQKNCRYFFSLYNKYCPKAWVEQWEEQVEKGIFPRDLTKEMGR